MTCLGLGVDHAILKCIELVDSFCLKSLLWLGFSEGLIRHGWSNHLFPATDPWGGWEAAFLMAGFGGHQRTAGAADQGVGSAEGGVHGLENRAELQVVFEGFQHQEAAQHHDLKAPLIKTRQGEGHGLLCALTSSSSPRRFSPMTLVRFWCDPGHASLAIKKPRIPSRGSGSHLPCPSKRSRSGLPWVRLLRTWRRLSF